MAALKAKTSLMSLGEMLENMGADSPRGTPIPDQSSFDDWHQFLELNPEANW